MITPSIEVESMKDVDFSDMTAPGVVIYFDTADFPRTFVARLWEFAKGKPTNTIIIRNSLAEIKEDLTAAGFNLLAPRSEHDDPVIVETWL